MELASKSVDTQQQQQQQQKEVEQHFHVLAVDDSMMDRKLLERLLQKVSSCRVTCVDSGDKALKYLGLQDDIDGTSSTSSPHPSEHEEMKVNLIMTDYCMPGMSGYDLLKKLKGSSWKDVPVVVMSSETFPSRISMCLEEGAKEFLLKPLQLSDLEKLQPYISKSTDHSEEQGSNCLVATDNCEDNCEGTKNVDKNDNSNKNNKKEDSIDSPITK